MRSSHWWAGLGLWACVGWLVSSLTVLGIGIAMLMTDFGAKTSHTETTGANAAITDTTERESLTALLLAGLGATSVLALPLKYAWDELALRNANRRQVEQETRSRIHSYIERYYMPIIYELRDLAEDSDHWRAELDKPPENQRTVIFDRWLYHFARVWQTRREMRRSGGSWWFQSREGETMTSRSFRDLIRQFDRICERVGNERAVFACAVSDAGSNLLTFSERFEPPERRWWRHTPDPWHPLRLARESILGMHRADPATTKDDLNALAKRARDTRVLIQSYATDIYSAWYPDEPSREKRDELDRAKADARGLPP